MIGGHYRQPPGLIFDRATAGLLVRCCATQLDIGGTLTYHTHTINFAATEIVHL